jgi:hypothetical protein
MASFSALLKVSASVTAGVFADCSRPKSAVVMKRRSLIKTARRALLINSRTLPGHAQLDIATIPPLEKPRILGAPSCLSMLRA